MGLEKKLIIFILTAITLIFLLYFMIAKPAFLEMLDLAKKIEKQKTELEALYQGGKTLSQIKGELKEIEEKNTMLDDIFLSENKELEFITILEKLSNENNIKQEISLKTKIPFENNYQIIPIRLSLQSSFNNLLTYFQTLENLNFYLNINSLNITGSSKSTNQEELLNVIIEADTYWLKKNN